VNYWNYGLTENTRTRSAEVRKRAEARENHLSSSMSRNRKRREVKGPKILSVGELLWGKNRALVYVTGFLEANQITIPDVELGVQAMAGVCERIHGGVEGKILANSTALGNPETCHSSCF
jgi:hypothetical protein